MILYVSWNITNFIKGSFCVIVSLFTFTQEFYVSLDQLFLWFPRHFDCYSCFRGAKTYFQHILWFKILQNLSCLLILANSVQFLISSLRDGVSWRSTSAALWQTKDIICQSEMTEVRLGLKVYQRYVVMFMKCVQWNDTITETFTLFLTNW